MARITREGREKRQHKLPFLPPLSRVILDKKNNKKFLPHEENINKAKSYGNMWG